MDDAYASKVNNVESGKNKRKKKVDSSSPTNTNKKGKRPLSEITCMVLRAMSRTYARILRKRSKETTRRMRVEMKMSLNKHNHILPLKLLP